MFSEQKVDASFGLALLAVGFFLQGAAGYGYKSANYLILGMGSALLTMALLAYWLSRRRLIKISFMRACRTLRADDGSPRFTEAKIEELWAHLND
jgi:hypothetical protein